MRKNGGVPSRTFAWSRSVHAADGAVIVQVIGEGTFFGADLPGGKTKATSLPFRGRRRAVLALDDHGKIACCTEYYDRDQATVRSIGVMRGSIRYIQQFSEAVLLSAALPPWVLRSGR